jgi:hypothetical protein
MKLVDLVWLIKKIISIHYIFKVGSLSYGIAFMRNIFTNFIKESVFVLIIALHIFRRNFRLTENELDAAFKSPSDYTVMIKRIPWQKNSDKEIRLALNKWYSGIPKSDAEKK